MHPDDRRGEHLVATRGRKRLHCAAGPRPGGAAGAVEPVEVEQLQQPVLAALNGQRWAAGVWQQRRRGAAEILVAASSAAPDRSACSCAAAAVASGASSSTLSPQSVLPLNGPLPVATRIAGPGYKHRARASPDRRVADAPHVLGTIR